MCDKILNAHLTRMLFLKWINKYKILFQQPLNCILCDIFIFVVERLLSLIMRSVLSVVSWISNSFCPYLTQDYFYYLLVCFKKILLAGEMTNLYPFIQGSLEWPFSNLTFSDVKLWNQYKYIDFNIFSCRILITLYKIIIIFRISDETRNELTIYAILCQNVTIFYLQELVSLFQVQEKLKTPRISKWNFSSSCFIVDDSHLKVVWPNVLVFTEHDILHFWNNVLLLIKILSNESTSKVL